MKHLHMLVTNELRGSVRLLSRLSVEECSAVDEATQIGANNL